MNLDPLAALLCGLVALFLFATHVVSSPRRKRWMTLPEYVRYGLFISGAMFMWRSVNFITQPSATVSAIGHINAEGVMALAALTYTAMSLAFWMASKRLPDLGWDRLRFAERKEREDPAIVPVMMTIEQVLEAERALGFHINAEPPEPKP